jgi:hypothetical protein
MGQSVQLTASATLPDGTHLNATSQVTWHSSAAAVVTVSATGLLTVVAPGEADVTATLQSVRGVVHVVVLKPAPPPIPTYDITGVVHESAPTENVTLAGATVGIHFAGCPTCPHDNQETTTDVTGHFTLPGIDTPGFWLVVSKPGYDTTDYYIAQLPRDQHPDIGVAPQFAIIQQIFEGTYNLAADCGVTDAGLACSKSLDFPVHHAGVMKILGQAQDGLNEWWMQVRQGEKVLCRVWEGACPPLVLQPGFVYTATLDGFDDAQVGPITFRVVFSHPN